MSAPFDPRLRQLLRAAILALTIPALGGASCDEGGGGGDGGGEGPAFVGSWRRASLVVDGMSLEFCNSQLDLTASTWKSYTTGGGGMYCDCALEGTLAYDDATMTWTNTNVSGQYCGVAAPGDVASFGWMVDDTGDTLTLTTGSQVETYTRISGGGGGGGGTGGSTGGGSESQSCDEKGTFGICRDFVGDGWTEADKEQACAMGILQTAPCDTNGTVGSCVFDMGGAMESVMHFYSDGTPPFDPAQAESNCANLGGTWQPA